jgi:hypothetical protein
VDSQAELAFELQEMRRRIGALESRTLILPYVEADPDPEEPANLWAFTDGRINFRGPDGVVRSIAGTTTRTTTSATAKPVIDDPEVSFDTTMTCEWIATYDGTGNLRVTEGQVFYGRDSEVWGRQSIMMGFENLRAELVGADIRYAEMILNSLYTWSDAGTRVFFGTHAVAGSTAPPEFSRKSIENFSTLVPDGGEVTFAVDVKFVEQLRDDVIDGFTVEQPDDNRTRFGNLADSVQLRVLYVK